MSAATRIVTRTGTSRYTPRGAMMVGVRASTAGFPAPASTAERVFGCSGAAGTGHRAATNCSTTRSH